MSPIHARARIWTARLAGLGFALALGPTAAHAESTAGVCPDGSMFIVADRADAPCARAKFVEPSELPPIKPEYLPRPYIWYVDQEIQDDKNPYNLVDDARRMRELRRGTAEPESEPRTRAPGMARTAPPPDPPTPATARGVQIELSPDEMRDLVQLVALRQQVAPATLTVDDAVGREALVIRFAYSDSFEDLVLRQLGRERDAAVVVAFTARAVRDVDFAPNFQLSQESDLFRPAADDPRELGLLVGEPGPLGRGTLALGYLVVPARFDPARPLELWWNDRRISATLR